MANAESAPVLHTGDAPTPISHHHHHLLLNHRGCRQTLGGGGGGCSRYGGKRCCHHGPPVTVGGDNDSSQRSSISRLNLLFMAPHPAPCAPGWTASFRVAAGRVGWGVWGLLACQSCRFAAATTTTTTTESNHWASCRKRTSVRLLRPLRCRFSPPATWKKTNGWMNDR